MADLFKWLNDNSGAISALAAAVTAWLTFSLRKSTRIQADVTSALRDIESNRDASKDPRVFIWFGGYEANSGIGTFVMQNSGGRSLFLQSLRLVSSGMDVEFLSKEPQTKLEESVQSTGELRNLVISPSRAERFHFKFKNGNGQHFELIAQLYTGIPARLVVDPSQLNGYELRAIGSQKLQAVRNGKPL